MPVYAMPVAPGAGSGRPNATATVEQSSSFEPFVGVVQTGTRMFLSNRDRGEHHIKVLSGLRPSSSTRFTPANPIRCWTRPARSRCNA